MNYTDNSHKILNLEVKVYDDRLITSEHIPCYLENHINKIEITTYIYKGEMIAWYCKSTISNMETLNKIKNTYPFALKDNSIILDNSIFNLLEEYKNYNKEEISSLYLRITDINNKILKDLCYI